MRVCVCVCVFSWVLTCTVLCYVRCLSGVNRDKYFLESGDVIRHFWEEKAFNEDGTPVQSLEQCINKIGHALHDLCPAFQEVSYEARVGSICKDLGLEVPTVVQSM